MLNVVEAFSGIGAQAKALEYLNVEYNIISTIEWDIYAFYAYDIIHNGNQDLSIYDALSKNEIIEFLRKFTLSSDGKKPLSLRTLEGMSLDTLKRVYCALERTHNLVSITDVKADDLPNNIDVFTYSFPCQDLSICGAWHNNYSGIARNANNRSGMLWEVERILKEFETSKKKMPKFLLMENVSNILSPRHIDNFNEWINYLNVIGYENKIYTLNARNFGIPQNRKRTFMISVYVGKNKQLRKRVSRYFEKNDLEKVHLMQKELKDFLRINYSIADYKREADQCTPNDTPSRRKIYLDNDKLYHSNEFKDVIKTITTKQDRNPNSGVIDYPNEIEGKSSFRYLTPRECFLLMGFEEEDFSNLIKNNFLNNGRQFYGNEKLFKLAGNSIVVNVLVEIFSQIIDIKEKVLNIK